MANAPAGRETGRKQGAELQRFAFILKNQQNRKLLTNSLVAGIDVDRLIKCAWIQAQTNDDIRELAQSNPSSVFRALIQCAQMGLYPDGYTGDAYLVRYGRECVAIRGYRGLVRLFTENCEVASKTMPIFYDTVHEKDEFSYERGTEPKLSHRPAIKNRGKITHYYACARFVDGSMWPKVMEADDVEKFRAYSKSSAFWDSPHENTRKWMRLKTVIKQLMKELPLPSVVRSEMEREDNDDGTTFIDAEVVDLIDGEKPHVYGDDIKKSQGRPKESHNTRIVDGNKSAQAAAANAPKEPERAEDHGPADDEPPPGAAYGDDPVDAQGEQRHIPDNLFDE